MESERTSKTVAWIGILIASDAADICWKLHSGHRLPLIFVLLRAVLLLAIAMSVRGFLRGFVVTLIAFLSGSFLQRMVEQHWAWFQQAAISKQMVADAWLALIPSALIAATLIGSGLTRKDVYLTAGNLQARVRGLEWIRVPGMNVPGIRWSVLAPLVFFVMGFGLTKQLTFILGKGSAPVHLNWLALIFVSLTFAMINAFNEEFRFRFVLLARGRRAVGANAAFWMTSVNFGLAHWVSGHPGGPTGFVTTMLFAMLLARSLYDTEGGLWAWIMHGAADVIIIVVVLLRVG